MSNPGGNGGSGYSNGGRGRGYYPGGSGGSGYPSGGGGGYYPNNSSNPRQPSNYPTNNPTINPNALSSNPWSQNPTGTRPPMYHFQAGGTGGGGTAGTGGPGPSTGGSGVDPRGRQPYPQGTGGSSQTVPETQQALLAKLKAHTENLRTEKQKSSQAGGSRNPDEDAMDTR